jgi:hypothetical protein
VSARVSIVALVLAAVAVGCWVDETPFTPKPCGPGRSCPAFYTCVDSSEGVSLCQASYPPGKPDATVTPAGPFRDFCHDAYPLFDQYCVECHGPDQQLGVLRFRLDFYLPDAGFIGAQQMAPAIRKEVFVFRTMPPQEAREFPTLAERLTMAEWVDAGAPFCGPLDGGTADGGDGG